MDCSKPHQSGAPAEKFKALAKQEIKNLKLLNKIDHQKGFIVRLKESFKFKKAYCLVFEHLEKNLAQILSES